MKALVTIHQQRPPHKVIADVDVAARVDRVLTRTGRGKFALDVPHSYVHNAAADIGLGDLVAIRSTVQGVGLYVGVVTQLEERAGRGTLEVSGDNFSSILYGIALDRALSYDNRGAGEIARQLLRMGQAFGRSIFLRDGTLRGTPLYSFTAPINFGAQHFGNALDALCKRTGDEWWITHRYSRTGIDHYLHLNTRRGYDLTSRVYLEEGRDFTQLSYRRDSLGQTRAVIAVGGGAASNERPTVAVTANIQAAAGRASQAFTPLAPTIQTSPLGGRDAIEYNVADSDLTGLASSAQRRYRYPPTFSESLAVTIPLTAASTFGPGDYISMRFYSLHRASTTLSARVNAIQPDEASGEADLDVTI
jgi:hypothetical protein